jgi:hypothetical protein
MWRIVLGIGVLVQGGIAWAGEESPAQRDCPAGEECAADEATATEAPEAPATETPAPAAQAPSRQADAPVRDAFATVNFRNDVDNKLRLVEARFRIDGVDVPGVLTGPERGKSYVVISGPMKSGAHIVTVRLTYQGARRVFSYMKGYKLNVRADQVLTAPANRTVSFTIVGAENKGMTVPLDKRVVVKVEESAARQ